MTNTTNFRAARGREPITGLVGDLQADIKDFIRQEIELAKAEWREKFKSMGRHAVFAAAGAGMGALAALLFFLGIGALIAWALEHAGLSPSMSFFIGYCFLAMLLGGIGAVLLSSGMHGLSQVSLTPEKTLSVLDSSVKEPGAQEIKVEQPKPGSDEIQHDVEITRARMDADVNELLNRMKPHYVIKSTLAGLKHHPVRALLISAGTGLGGYFMLRHQKNGHVPAKIGARKAAFRPLQDWCRAAKAAWLHFRLKA